MGAGRLQVAGCRGKGLGWAGLGWAGGEGLAAVHASSLSISRYVCVSCHVMRVCTCVYMCVWDARCTEKGAGFYIHTNQSLVHAARPIPRYVASVVREPSVAVTYRALLLS